MLITCFVFPIVVIRPTIEEVEKVIKYLGLLCLTLYFIQQAILPIPIVESLTSGWRKANDAGVFDIKRFTITGEIIMFLFQLMSLNKYFVTKNKKSYCMSFSCLQCVSCMGIVPLYCQC